MVFRNGGKRSNSDNWYWGQQPLNVTERYMYLGYPLTSTNSFKQAALYYKGKALAASGAVWPILTRSKMNSFKSSMKLLDAMVLSTLLYAAPVWANEHTLIVDQIQDSFMRRYLNLPRYTPRYMHRIELGRVSLSVTVLKLTLKFWLRMLGMGETRLPMLCLSQLWEISNATKKYIGFTGSIVNILNTTGFQWLNFCTDYRTLQREIPHIIRTAIDQSLQKDHTRITNSRLYPHYKNICSTPLPEHYLSSDFPLRVKRGIAGLRILSVLFTDDHPKIFKTDVWTCEICGTRMEPGLHHHILSCMGLKDERDVLLSEIGLDGLSLELLLNEVVRNRAGAFALFKFWKTAEEKRKTNLKKGHMKQIQENENCQEEENEFTLFNNYIGIVNQIRKFDSFKTKVQHKDNVENLVLIIVDGKGPNLLGRDWMIKIPELCEISILTKSMVSYDVNSMYLSLPHQLIITQLTKFLQDIHLDSKTVSSIVALSSICLDITEFTFNNQFFKQIRGSPMGSPLSSPLAEIVMSTLDNWIQRQFTPGIHIWRRYIDDILCIDICLALQKTKDSAGFWKAVSLFRKRSSITGKISIAEWQTFYAKLLSTTSNPEINISLYIRYSDPLLDGEIIDAEIETEILKLKNGKAPGIDDIPNEAIKALHKDQLKRLVCIFNLILENGSFPSLWSKLIIYSPYL
ncbi:hypothetical protein LAZ67_4001939 [Cordylochernes scorpioides]|uniref:Reverse transcriptase domain-containing protein n=1 Tax=Cordylochernes scorpioides TaxID=51811 RepID=A0ABY6KFS7_9ARAC|nr:hypothetical protein LAZ67_4001939 [Cordylochernes scorpioides]